MHERSSIAVWLFLAMLPMAARAAESQPAFYKNPAYGFQIRYPEGLAVAETEKDEIRTVFAFQKATKDPEWIRLTGSGWAPVFYVKVYTHASYAAETAECKKDGFSSSYCLRLLNVHGENKQFVIVVDDLSVAPMTPEDMSEKDLAEGKKCLETLKVFEPEADHKTE